MEFPPLEENEILIPFPPCCDKIIIDRLWNPTGIIIDGQKQMKEIGWKCRNCGQTFAPSKE